MIGQMSLRAGIPLVAVVLAAGGALAVATADSLFSVSLAVVLGAALALHVLLLPTEWLPSIALVVHALVPAPPVPILQQGLTPSVGALVMLVWVVRRLFTDYQRDGGFSFTLREVLPTVVLGAWLVVSLLFSIDRPTSVSWMFVLAVSVLMFTVSPVEDRDVDLLVRTWALVSALIALHVVLETLMGGDLLYGWVHDQFGNPSVQHWSTYRPEGPFRHPLPVATFLAVGACLAFAQGVQRGRGWYWGVGALSALAAGLTLSRGPLVALVVATLVVWVMWDPRRHRAFSEWRHTLMVLGAIVLVAGLSVGPLADRLSSLEAERSAQTRSSVVEISLDTAREYPLVGSGPGTSEAAARPWNPQDLPIESSILQLLISTGIIGVLLFLWMIGTHLVRAIRNRNLAGTAGLVAMMGCAALFNVAESRESLLLFLGLLVVICRRAPVDSEPADDPHGEHVGGERLHPAGVVS